MSQNRTIEEALRQGKMFLKAHHVESYSLDTQLLLMRATGLTKVQLYSQKWQMLSPEEEELFQEYLLERGQGKPAQYIIGQCEFMGMDFFVEEGILIPRPDTETLVEAVLEKAQKGSLHNVLDIGTGTGCIPISLARYGGMYAWGVDVDQHALELAARNARKNQVSCVEWIESNLFEAIPKKLYGAMDAVVSNPPYIPTDEIPTLMREVKDYEPVLALDGGIDGLDFYRKITQEAGKFLKENGYVFFEIGYNQAKEVAQLLEKENYEEIEVRKDLAGLDRVMIARKKS